MRICPPYAHPVCHTPPAPELLTLSSAGAQAIRVITLAFPDPSGPSSAGEPHRVNSSLSYDFSLEQNIRTLSTNGATSGNDITGLLYTPDLAQDDPCFNASLPYVPTKATRPSNFPNNARYQLVALAPWISPTCTLSYLAAARELQTLGFLFFMTNDNNDVPPLANDAYWSVGDGGKWKSDNQFPVYVLPGASGSALINATADYSGDLLSVPNAEQLLKTEDLSDYIRLYADIDTGESNSQFPGMCISISCAPRRLQGLPCESALVSTVHFVAIRLSVSITASTASFQRLTCD